MTVLGPMQINRKTGEESFFLSSSELDVNLLSFWQWGFSDLVSSSTRGIFAEFIVALSFGVAEKGFRDEWASYDLCTSDGIKVEVKSSSYIQSWHQDRLSKITFRVPKTKTWDRNTNQESESVSRQADVYVFALLANMDQSTLNPLDLDQWEFYILPTFILDERTDSQHSITLATLQRLANEPSCFSNLKTAIEEAGALNAVKRKP